MSDAVVVIVEILKRRLNAFQDVDNSHYGVARISAEWQLLIFEDERKAPDSHATALARCTALHQNLRPALSGRRN